jgi:hypothetical protein
MRLLLTLLGQEQGKSALQSNTLARPLVVGGDARGVSGLGDLAVGDLLEGVEAVAAGVEGVHQMHSGRLVLRSNSPGRVMMGVGLGVACQLVAGFVRLAEERG